MRGDSPVAGYVKLVMSTHGWVANGFHERPGLVQGYVELQASAQLCAHQEALITYNNNNNNNNIHLLQMGCHPVAVITLHVYPNTANKFT
jgi:hypothetical protein